MEKIKRGLFGYNRRVVHDIMLEKDELISKQQKDIDYLRGENQTLQTKLASTQDKNTSTNTNKTTQTKMN